MIKRNCPKCGCDDLNIIYHGIGEDIQDDFGFNNTDRFKEFGGKVKLDKNTHNNKIKIKKECLDIHCRTCQYDWVTNIASPVLCPTTTEIYINPDNIIPDDFTGIKWHRDTLTNDPCFGTDTFTNEPYFGYKYRW